MKRFLLIILAVMSLSPVLRSQTINYSSVKVKTKTEKEKRIYTFPYEQFIMLNYGAVGGNVSGNSLGLQYGQVHIGGWYVSADVSLSYLHFANTCTAYEGSYNRHNAGRCFVVDAGRNVYPHFIAGKTSFNRVSVGGGGIVRLVIPLYFYLGLGYMYQTVTAETEEYGWVEMNRPYSSNYSPHSSGYVEVGLQGNIKGFTMRLGYRYGFSKTNELSVGLGVTLGRESKKSNPKTDE